MGPTRAEQWNVPSSSSLSVFDTEGREYILQEQDTGLPQAPSNHLAPLPYTQAGSTPTLSQGKGKSTASRHGKRKQEDQHGANVKAQAIQNAQQIANQAAREVVLQQEQAQAHLRGLREEAHVFELARDARDAALAHIPKATQHTPGRTGETPEGAEHGVSTARFGLYFSAQYWL